MKPAFLSNPLTWLVLGIMLMGVGAFLVLYPLSSEEVPEYHIHADFAVFLAGEKIDFAQAKYMSEAGKPFLSSYVHLHDMDGGIIHVHKEGITLGDFFRSIGMSVETTNQTITFTTDTPQTYTASRFGCFEQGDGLPSICVDPAPNAVMFQVIINGAPYAGRIEDYVIQDLDRILITYGPLNETDAFAQYAQVTDAACIQSGKCPERGAPSDESTCTTSGGCAVGTIATGA